MKAGAAKAARLNALGMAAARSGRAEEAERSFTAAAAADPANVSSYMNLLALLLPAGRYGRAAAVAAAARRGCNPGQLAGISAALEGSARRAAAGIKRRLLLVSLADTIENRLFELAFLKEAAGRASTALDLAVPPSVFRLSPPPFSFSERFLCAAGKPFAGTPASYNAVIFADFPSPDFIEPFCGLLAAGQHKHFVCLRLLPRRGDSHAADLAAYRRLFSGVKTVFALEHDGAERAKEFGVPRSALRRYPFSVNTGYYAPAGTAGKYLFSAGNSARDYAPLVRAAGRLGVPLLIRTDLPLKAAPGLTVKPLSGAHEALRPELAGALAVAVPFKPSVSIAANSIATMAMASGKPVLTNDTPVLRGLIAHGKDGFLYSERKTGDLERRLKGMLALGPAGLAAIGAAARAKALRHADSALLARRVLDAAGAE